MIDDRLSIGRPQSRDRNATHGRHKELAPFKREDAGKQKTENSVLLVLQVSKFFILQN